MLAACMACGAAGAKTTKVHYRLSISSGSGPTWAVVRDVPAEAKGATVYLLDARRGRTEIPSQLDDLDGDGVFVDMQPGERADVRVDYSTKEVAHDYKPLVNAQMWWKNPDKTLTEKSQLSSLKDDMYRKLHHHGPAFESEYAAYRIYFDKKQSIDTYGKRQPRLELRETMWYPSDEQLAAGYGHDNLRVFGTVSIGALKGWNPVKRRMEHIVDMRRREATIRAYGPLRTVVDMRVEGWNYGGREIDMTSRYILYGGCCRPWGATFPRTIRSDGSARRSAWPPGCRPGRWFRRSTMRAVTFASCVLSAGASTIGSSWGGARAASSIGTMGRTTICRRSKPSA